MPPDGPDASRGVFETLLVRDGRVQALAAHLDRLARSVHDLYGLALPAELPGTLLARAADLTGEHRLRVDAVPGEAAAACRFETSPLPADRPRRFRCVPVVIPGGLGAHKWRDRRLLEGLGTGDAVPLLIDRDGDVLEAAWGNFWCLDGDVVLTPAADARLLAGVTRERLLELAPRLGLSPRVERIPLAAALSARHTFLTSSLALAVPVTLGETPAEPAGPAIAAIRAGLEAEAWTGAGDVPA